MSAALGVDAIPAVTAAEREVADALPIEADPVAAREVLASIPLWFHTFALSRTADVYTPGIARDHRYRLPALAERFDGARVLDVGTFDGFYAFLAEARGAQRVVAIDNEQYVAWVRARWDRKLRGGEGFEAIARLLGSRVEYLRLDAMNLGTLRARFDTVLCFGILHRVDDPLGLLRVLRARLAPGGTLLLETHGARKPRDDASIEVNGGGQVYARDDYVYWGFGTAALERLALLAGYAGFDLIDAPDVDGHPRIIGALRAASIREPDDRRGPRGGRRLDG